MIARSTVRKGSTSFAMPYHVLQVELDEGPVVFGRSADDAAPAVGELVEVAPGEAPEVLAFRRCR